jgi:hypothetical protein
MVASAKPFLPESSDGKDVGLATERRGRDTSRTEVTVSTRSSMLRSASADPRMELSGTSYPPAATARNDAPLVGLMSGRGLY